MSSVKTRALTALLSWFGRTPTANRLRIGAALAWITLRVAKRRVHIVRTNIGLCFPDEPVAVRERWVREHIRALSQSFGEVGVRTVEVGPATTDTVRVTVTVPTAELAVSGEVQSCQVA